MINQHKNSIPEIKDLSEQRYLMRVQQKLKDPLQYQQQQNQYLQGIQEPNQNKINDNLNHIQIQQQYGGKIEPKKFGQQEFMEDISNDQNQLSPHVHRTNQQRSKTISLMNYKEIRNSSLENNQRGANQVPQQLNNQSNQQQDQFKREQTQPLPISALNNGFNLQSPSHINSYPNYEYSLNSNIPYYSVNPVLQQQYSMPQNINYQSSYTTQQPPQNLNYTTSYNQNQYATEYNRINNHQLNFIEAQNTIRSNSQQGYLDCTNTVRNNSQLNHLDLNGGRSNSQQGNYNNTVNTPLGQKSNNHLLSQNQTFTSQTQGNNNQITNNNNSIESIVDLENKWSDIKKAHQNFQQRSLSNSSSSNSIAANHRPNSSLNVSTNNNLSFINASNALIDQGASTKNYQNTSLTATPLDSNKSLHSNNNNNNNSKLIKKVVPLSKINLNSIIQTTGPGNFQTTNASSTSSNASKNNKMKLNLHGSFQDQFNSDKNLPFESQSLPGSTRGHHDSFQGLGQNSQNSMLNNNNSYSNQLFEFDSRPTTQNSYIHHQKSQDNINTHNFNTSLHTNYLNQNNLSLDNGFFSHQTSLIHVQSQNDMYNGSTQKLTQLTYQNPQHQNQQQQYYQNPQQLQNVLQPQNLPTQHQKCLSYQHLKPQLGYANNAISVQGDQNLNKLQNQILNNQLNYNNYEATNTSGLMKVQSNSTGQHNQNRSDSNLKYQYNAQAQSPSGKSQQAYIANFYNTSQGYSNHQQPFKNEKQQFQEINQYNNYHYQMPLQQNTQSNLSTANFKQPSSFIQEISDLSLTQNISNPKSSFIYQKKDNNNESLNRNQDLILSPQNQKSTFQYNQEANRQNHRISPNRTAAQHASSKERSNSRSASDMKNRKKSQDEVSTIQDINKKKNYSEQQFEYLKQLIPTYTNSQAKKNLFTQALAQQKGSFDLNPIISGQNGVNQLDFIPARENSSLNEIDNHLQQKYNEYKQRLQQQSENILTLGADNSKSISSTTINTNSSQQTNSHTHQNSLSQKKRLSQFINNAQNQKEVLLKDHYQTANISEIVKDQRKSSVEYHSKLNLNQKAQDQENRNPNNSQPKQLDHQSLLKLKQGMKHSNSQGQNEFQQIQMQMQQQQQLHSVNIGVANTQNNQQIQNGQQKTYSPRVNYKIISENIKKQKSGVVQKNEKIIQNNQTDQLNKNQGSTIKEIPSYLSTMQMQQFFPDQPLAPISKSFIESKKIQPNTNPNSEKSVNEMYDNNKVNCNNLNIINKKNGKLTEIPLKQVVSKKILPKYQQNNIDQSEEQYSQLFNSNTKQTIQHSRTYQKTQNDETKKKKLSITQADLNLIQTQNSSKITQQQAPQSTKYNSQQTGFQKSEPEKPLLKRQHSSSTSNTIYDPFKTPQEQQGAKPNQSSQYNSQLNEQQYFNQKLIDNISDSAQNQNAQNQVAQIRQSHLINRNNPPSNYNKIQCMPCNKNLVETKLQKKEEQQQFKQPKAKGEIKMESKDPNLSQALNKQVNGVYNQQNKYQPQQTQQQVTQPKYQSSFIMPNLVFN